MTIPMLTRSPDRARGPAPGLTLASCHDAGCTHDECHQAAQAAGRLPILAVGSRRRLQALALNGFPERQLALRLDVAQHVVRGLQHGQTARVTAHLAARVLALYDELWDQRGGSPRTRRIARARDWAPALAWDDDLPGDPWYSGYGIDDPDATPAPGWQRPRPALAPDELAAELTELIRLGLSVNKAAQRLGLSGVTLRPVRDDLPAVAS